MARRQLKYERKCNKIKFIVTHFSKVTPEMKLRVGSNSDESLYIKKNEPHFL
jgi:hypothetical protein